MLSMKSEADQNSHMEKSRDGQNGRSAQSPELLISIARAGDPEALGRLIGLYRNYLKLIARGQMATALRLRIESSDLVQETCLEAFRDFHQFTGRSERELLGWLRQILARNLVDQVRKQKAERALMPGSLESMVEESSRNLEKSFAAVTLSPSDQAVRREQSVILADALAQLSEDHQKVIVLRHLNHLKFEEVATRLGRSISATKMLWGRAIEKLRKILEENA